MRLLLTVTGPREVSTALAAGADLVDVKDPARGSLGSPGRECLHRVALRLAGRAPVGVPLGDGPHRPGALTARVSTAVRAGAEYLKVGLLRPAPPGPGAGEEPPGRTSEPNLSAPAALKAVREAAADAEGRCVVMAVTFADAPAGAAPSPEELVRIASAAGSDGVMVDTLGKAEGSVVEAMGPGRLRRWCRSARARGLLTAVAGGLDAPGIGRLRGVGADVVGVRGGACDGGRDGRLDPVRCRALRRAVDSVPGGGAGPRVRPG